MVWWHAEKQATALPPPGKDVAILMICCCWHGLCCLHIQALLQMRGEGWVPKKLLPSSCPSQGQHKLLPCTANSFHQQLCQTVSLKQPAVSLTSSCRWQRTDAQIWKDTQNTLKRLLKTQHVNGLKDLISSRDCNCRLSSPDHSCAQTPPKFQLYREPRGGTLQESSCLPPTRAKALPAHNNRPQRFLVGPAGLAATYPHPSGTTTDGKLHLSMEISKARLFQGLFSRGQRRRSFKTSDPSDSGQTPGRVMIQENSDSTLRTNWMRGQKTARALSPAW